MHLLYALLFFTLEGQLTLRSKATFFPIFSLRCITVSKFYEGEVICSAGRYINLLSSDAGHLHEGECNTTLKCCVCEHVTWAVPLLPHPPWPPQTKKA